MNTTDIKYAGFWERGGALFIDALIMIIPSFLVGAVFSAAFSNRVEMSGGSEAESLIGGYISAKISVILLGWVYFATMESSRFQGTLGKHILGLRVVDLNGNRLTFAHATGRFLCKFISTIPFGLGFFIQPFTNKRQAFHDIIAACVVMKLREGNNIQNAQSSLSPDTASSVKPSSPLPDISSNIQSPTLPVTENNNHQLKTDMNHNPQIAVQSAPAPVLNNDDTELYAKAMKEVDDPASRNPGVWAKVFCEFPKDEALAKASYIKVRVGQMLEIRKLEIQTVEALEHQKMRSLIEHHITQSIEIRDADQLEEGLQEYQRVTGKPLPGADEMIRRLSGWREMERETAALDRIEGILKSRSWEQAWREVTGKGLAAEVVAEADGVWRDELIERRMRLRKTIAEGWAKSAEETGRSAIHEAEEEIKARAWDKALEILNNIPSFPDEIEAEYAPSLSSLRRSRDTMIDHIEIILKDRDHINNILNLVEQKDWAMAWCEVIKEGLTPAVSEAEEQQAVEEVLELRRQIRDRIEKSWVEATVIKAEADQQKARQKIEGKQWDDAVASLPEIEMLPVEIESKAKLVLGEVRKRRQDLLREIKAGRERQTKINRRITLVAGVVAVSLLIVAGFGIREARQKADCQTKAQYALQAKAKSGEDQAEKWAPVSWQAAEALLKQAAALKDKKEWEQTGKVFLQAQQKYDDAREEARKAFYAAEVAAALSSARAGKASGEWEKVKTGAEKALGLNPGDKEGLALKAEAERNLEPTLQIIAMADGLAVGATVTDGNVGRWTTPTTLKLTSDQSYMFEVSYSGGGKHWQREKCNVTANWRGERKEQVVLKELKRSQPGEPFTLELGEGVVMEFVWVEALKMWVGKYEVTNGEYRKFKSDHNSGEYKGNSLNGDRQPVVMVNFDDAKKYAAWIDRTIGDKLPEGYRVRLPSEWEWMTFAQCGDGRGYPWGNEWPPKYGNYCGQETKGIAGSMISDWSDDAIVACAVESSGKNTWGLYGVGGNVWEACASDIVGAAFGAWRGASWFNLYQDCLRCSFRSLFGGSIRFSLGFRLVLSR